MRKHAFAPRDDTCLGGAVNSCQAREKQRGLQFIPAGQRFFRGGEDEDVYVDEHVHVYEDEDGHEDVHVHAHGYGCGDGDEDRGAARGTRTGRPGSLRLNRRGAAGEVVEVEPEEHSAGEVSEFERAGHSAGEVVEVEQDGPSAGSS